MIVVYIVPIYFIIALIVILIGGVYQIASGIYMILVICGTIVGIIAGIYAIAKSFGVISSTKRIYLLIPPVFFLTFGVVGISIFRQSFCLSENWIEWSGIGTLMVHDNAVFRWALLAALIVSALFAIFFFFSCKSENVIISLLLSLVSIAIIVIPTFVIHSWGENKYYEKHSQSYEQIYKVKEDVEVKLYVNESYHGGSLNVSGEDDIIRKIFPQKLKKGETVYGEAILDEYPIEVFDDDGTIGKVAIKYLEPQTNQ